jgi:L-alanine-DL-glutamate epimerase-like enolase superfamily enzyme
MKTSVLTSVTAVDGLEVSAFTVPTDAAESDGTLEWDSTTIVVVAVQAGASRGLGFTYGDAAVAKLVEGKLAPLIVGNDPMDVSASWLRMAHSIRNLGRAGYAPWPSPR